ncbi:hypothetical protein C8R45DRAFT_936998 [Mycena sanguinolenta]|nr:hypothetical protein C8R45DRAFT_936998 [Mycena sanguinolenta]
MLSAKDLATRFVFLSFRARLLLAASVLFALSVVNHDDVVRFESWTGAPAASVLSTLRANVCRINGNKSHRANWAATALNRSARHRRHENPVCGGERIAESKVEQGSGGEHREAGISRVVGSMLHETDLSADSRCRERWLRKIKKELGLQHRGRRVIGEHWINAATSRRRQGHEAQVKRRISLPEEVGFTRPERFTSLRHAGERRR